MFLLYKFSFKKKKMFCVYKMSLYFITTTEKVYMNKIFKMMTACLVLPVSFLCADTQEVQDERNSDSCCSDSCCVENSFGYLNIGVGPLPMLFPSFGIGYKAQKNHHGFDVSGSIAKTRFDTTGRVSALYNYFFLPNLQSQFYAGLGVGMKGVHLDKSSDEDKCHVAVYPEIVFGKQYQNDTCCQRFFQVQIGFPSFAFDKFAKKTWKDREDGAGIYYPVHYATSYVPEVIFSYGIGF